MELKFLIQTKINKPVEEVFDSIINPKKLTGYFCEKSNGPLVEGQTVRWTWSKDDVDVKVKQIIPNSKIVIEWPAETGGTSITEMTFSTLEGGLTMIAITESGWPENAEGLKASYKNCQGWQHMLSCMRAYLLHGIDLRK